MRNVLERIENLSSVKQNLLSLKLAKTLSKENVSKDPINKQRLFAYIIPEEKESNNNIIDSKNLRTHLSTYLPSYMIPSNFIFTDAFPLKPNGKVDIKTLMQLKSSPKTSNEKNDLALPLSDNEKTMTAIWEELLEIDTISVYDNFFELGGDSILAIQLGVRIKQEFGIQLQMTKIFESPTIKELSQSLENTEPEKSWRFLIPIQPEGTNPPIFAIHNLGEGFHPFRTLAKHLGEDQPLYGLFYGFNSQNLEIYNKNTENEVEELASVYVEEMIKFQPEGPYFIIGACYGGNIAYEMCQQLIDADKEIGALILLDSFGPGGSKRLPFAKKIKTVLNGIPELGISGTFARIKTYIKFKIEEFQNSTSPFEHPSEHSEYPGDVILFRAMDRGLILRYEIDPYLGWSSIVKGNLEVYDYPGGHNELEIMTEPHITILADRIKLSISQFTNKDL